LATAQFAWQTWKAARARYAGGVEAVPDGYVMVPVEPTDEMCEALESVLRDHGFSHDDVGELSKAACWDAMIAASKEGQ
jgi:hypothetical protein